MKATLFTWIMMIQVFLLTFTLTACGDSHETHEEKDYTTIVHSHHMKEEPITIKDLNEAFVRCETEISLDCSAGQKISERKEKFNYGCDIFILSSGDVFYRFKENQNLNENTELNLFSLGEITRRIFNFENSDQYSKFPELTIELKGESWYPDTRLITTEIIQEEDLLNCEVERNSAGNVCWAPATQKHLQRFERFCKSYGRNNIIN